MKSIFYYSEISYLQNIQLKLSNMPTSFAAPASSLETARYGGFWIRFVALVIDALLLGVVQMLVIAPILGLFGLGTMTQMDPEAGAAAFSAMMGAMGLVQVFSLVIGFLYFVMMESSKYQGTFGKVALGLKVVDQDGMPLSFGKAALRYVGKMVSGIILGIGYLIAAFNPRKQALHDMIASTFVIKK